MISSKLEYLLRALLQMHHIEGLELSQSVLSNLCDPMDCSPQWSSVHEVLQARILEWVSMTSFRRSSQLQESKLGFLHYRQILYALSYQGRPLEL